MSTNKKIVLALLGLVTTSVLLGAVLGATIQKNFDQGKTSLTAQEADRIYAEGFAWGEAEGRANK